MTLFIPLRLAADVSDGQAGASNDGVLGYACFGTIPAKADGVPGRAYPAREGRGPGRQSLARDSGTDKLAAVGRTMDVMMTDRGEAVVGDSAAASPLSCSVAARGSAGTLLRTQSSTRGCSHLPRVT